MFSPEIDSKEITTSSTVNALLIFKARKGITVSSDQ